jgi:hydroxymethylpyrimidine/phosphomethylpyrimidine kinase
VTSNHYPIVLSFSGHDPSGGAGIQADIETLASLHCHCVSVITALTEQDSSNVKKIYAQSPQTIIAQAETLLNDMAISVIKIGLIGNDKTANAIAYILKNCVNIPVIFDPVLVAGGGKSVSNSALIEAINAHLLSYTHILTPNGNEARLLANLKTTHESALALQQKGCDYVLVTGADENLDANTVTNLLFYQQRCVKTFAWARLYATYHGSGCTLASSIAGFIAQGLAPLTAITQAQHYTWETLKYAYRTGKGQYNPNRLVSIATK